MRLLGLLAGLVVLTVALPCAADTCRLCEQLEATQGLGRCAQCDAVTVSPVYPLCAKCAKQLGQCERCRTDLTEALPPATQPAVDPRKSDRYTAGRWEYQLDIRLPGTRSEGAYGTLLFDGVPVPPPTHINDYHPTPLGTLYWAGQPSALYGPHGWVTQPRPAEPSGSRLPHPAGLVRTTVHFQLLTESPTGANTPIEPWILKEAKELGVKDLRIEQDWLAASVRPAVLHDSRHFGTAQLHYVPTPGNKPVTLEITGDSPETVHLPRRHGATRLLKYTLGTNVGTRTFYLACRVEAFFQKVTIHKENPLPMPAATMQSSQ